MQIELPTLSLLPGRHRRLAQGYPWAYSNEVAMDEAARALSPGALVHLQTAAGEAQGTAFFNKRSLIAARLLTPSSKQAIDAAFFQRKIERVLALRDALYPEPFYRLIHAEADGIPATVVDRYGDTLVIQLNCAGMEAIKDALIEALDLLLKPKVILLNDGSAAREQEELPAGERVLRGTPADPLPLRENELTLFARASGGQKTGWFFDQRDNRAWIAPFAKGRRVVDAYCYAGGFALNAAKAGAESVLALDRSEAALDLGRRAAEANDLESCCTFERAEVFGRLAALAREQQAFGLTIVDPPAFAKGRKDLAQALKGYRKLARLAAQVTEREGILFIASCSGAVDAAAFGETVARGLQDAGRRGRILKLSGAAADHPLHPQLKDSAYLKALTIALD